jgi:signal transduction histidine kinase
VLPVADGSVAALTEFLLADGASPVVQSLATALARDPSLVLWTACVAQRGGAPRPRCVEDLGRWLAGHALEVLQWESADDARPTQVSAEELQWYGDRVAEALRVADLAAQLAAGRGEEKGDRSNLCDDHARMVPAYGPLEANWTSPLFPAGTAAETAFLLGLLHNGEQWLVAAGGGTGIAGGMPAEELRSCLPDWLSGVGQGISGAGIGSGRAAEAVRLAVRLLAGEASVGEAAEVDLEGCRRRAEEGRRLWLAPAEGVGDWLPLLAARLRRLAELEGRFQQTLEAEKLEAIAEFAAGAGHEINNPLAVISGRAQFFLKEERDPERRHAWALMIAQTKRVYEMIADMMLFARPPQPELGRIELAGLLDRIVEELSARAAEQETVLRRTGEAGPVEIEADGTQLTVAIEAICKNSLEALGREGHIEIDLQTGQQEVRIRICDDGPGIPPQERRHVFDPYYSARQAGRGLGLGLSKAWRIITGHGGTIEVDSQAGQGTAFTITLPL